MFILSSSLGHEVTGRVYMQCLNCKEQSFIDNSHFKDVKYEYVILKNNTSIVCKHCGAVHTSKDSYIPLDFTSLRPYRKQAMAPKPTDHSNNDFKFLISAIDWNTWD